MKNLNLNTIHYVKLYDALYLDLVMANSISIPNTVHLHMNTSGFNVAKPPPSLSLTHCPPLSMVWP